MREADGGGQREYHRRNQPRNHAETEQHESRNQVHEGRQRLHQIEHRPQGREQPRPVRGGYPQRHADGGRCQGGDHDQRQRLERRQPVALIEDEQQRQRDEGGEGQGTAQQPGQHGDRDDQQRRGQGAQQRGQRR